MAYHLDDQHVAEVVARNTSYLYASQELGVSRQTLTRKIQNLNLDISHFRPGRGRPRPDAAIFTLGTQREGVIRTRFAALDTCPYLCILCGQGPEWNGQPLTLQLDHINGNSYDNRVENLRWLCPNCHSQTDNYVGKASRGIKKPRKKVSHP